MQKQELSDRRHLCVIKASAGSGKTHRLTGEYLHLLFSGENSYRHILAVTFTNKATDEMKSRILQELHRLSAGEKSPYLPDLMEKFSLSETVVRAKAKNILETILHDYSAFSISTIDRFFQQTMRAFTREMGLSGGYRLELDETLILSQIVELMIFELDKPENKEVAGWILAYMKNQIEEGKSWNIRENIGKLAKQLFNEKYKLQPDSAKTGIEDKNRLTEYRKTLVKIMRAWENEQKATAERALNLMRRFNLSYTDFKYGKNSGFLTFTKLANGDFSTPSDRFFNRADNLEDWVTAKSDKKTEIEAAYFEGLNNCVKEVVEFFENNTFYNTAAAILQNFYTLGILNDVRNRLRAYQRENNTLFLSDTTELLNKIIDDSESPFIYEKTGSRITNYMIDEFQDTSQMQWRNFRPLVKESLDGGNFNLIVGDVKQSIYRWRNSDWGLLENQIPIDFANNSIRDEALETNWRSDAQVVRFNNAFFAAAAEILQTDFNQSTNETEDFSRRILDAYQHVFQHVPSKKEENNGHVKITFLDNSDKENDWKSQALEQLPLEIESLQEQGFALKDIAILVRKNSEAVEVAETLLKYKEERPESKYRFDIISNEALVISNAQSVKAAVALLRHFRNRKDETLRMLAVYEFYRFHRKLSPETAIDSYFGQQTQDFPAEIQPELNRIAILPFYEMIEAFFALSENAIDEKENAYVQAFLDIALKFSAESSSNINDFLDWWDEKGSSKTLFSPDSQDAIRLISIHKSKGLGFGAVILPFLNWEIDHRPTLGPVLWCNPSQEPFNALGILPLEYKKSLADTIFRADYLEEKLYTYIDNLNLLYVAFTRAKHNITAFAPKKPAKDSVKDIPELMWKAMQTSMQENITDDNESAVFELGQPAQFVSETEKQAAKPEPTRKWQSIPFANRLKLRLNSLGFFSNDGSRDYGTLMHEIVSEIRTISDLENALGNRYIAGEITAQQKSEFGAELSEILSGEEVSDWYSGKYQVINETQVLHPNFGFSRPDRVMIGDNEVIVVDYKFGEVEDAKHKKQVQYYVKNIQEMGYENVKGFVFYVKSGKVREV